MFEEYYCYDCLQEGIKVKVEPTPLGQCPRCHGRKIQIDYNHKARLVQIRLEDYEKEVRPLNVFERLRAIKQEA